MKCLLIVLLWMLMPFAPFAQKQKTAPVTRSKAMSKKQGLMPVSKHVLYTDIGISLSRFYPGLSATYNYRLSNWFGIGIGAHGYFFYPTMTNEHQFVPAVFADFRFNIRSQRRNQFFSYFDVGADFYQHTDKLRLYKNKIHNVPGDNGVYVGIGLGYLRVTSKRGGGPYASLKLILNGYNTDTYELATQDEYRGAWFNGTGVVSFGFRF